MTVGRSHKGVRKAVEWFAAVLYTYADRNVGCSAGWKLVPLKRRVKTRWGFESQRQAIKVLLAKAGQRDRCGDCELSLCLLCDVAVGLGFSPLKHVTVTDQLCRTAGLV